MPRVTPQRYEFTRCLLHAHPRTSANGAGLPTLHWSIWDTSASQAEKSRS